ncbi:FAD-binding oxidoreductase [Prochlorococcus marinus]|uniref:FAD-binding protein n=1 Tax=Prochlorococcus marinus XMU1408 TaxID=2213228 RepID=A0A318QYV1_PROMR|nr:FAD-binding oxidoreductase [Prochlorococcus marinus]MBW3042483.1 FAD-binding protein [Prochlorococcus marinus str. XMU1408]PYE01214.1 FAD-binding protein [Prochlorococcus marinus XMU1408]
MSNKEKVALLLSELQLISDLEIYQKNSDLQRFSKDFFDYSPILISELKDCLADIVVRPLSVDAIVIVAQICNKYSTPLTLRGSGTGNYGQCVPLKGGVVMIMSGLRKIRHFDPKSGEITVESGCLLREINDELIEHGRQLRLLPSTWRSASVGGFVAGGSGGIGSVRWGFLRDPGHLQALEIVTTEDSPRKLELDAKNSEALNHAYGTNGIITALTLTTAAYVKWQQIVVDCLDWDQAIDLLIKFNCAALELYLGTLLDKEIVSCLPHWSGKPSGKHRILLLVSPDGVSTIERLSRSVGAGFNDLGPENLKAGTGLRELSWNHTTLHMRGIDPEWTYLQMLLPQPESEMMRKLKSDWGPNLLWHLECVRQNGVQRLASLPIVKWQGEEAMNRLILQCKELGAVIFNPHTITVEDGGLGVIDSDQVQAKSNFDPKGILNPGKLKGWKIKDN